MSRSGAAARARALLGIGNTDTAASATQDVAVQTEEVEPWVLANPDGAELRTVCQELVAENEDLQTQVEELTQQLILLESIATTMLATPAPLELGYIVLRTPDSLSHLRGHHRATWGELLRRLSLTPQSSRAGFYIRLYTTPEAAQDLWRQQRLALPIPVDPK